MRRKRKSFLVSLLLILVLVFSGCQTAAVQEDQTASVSQGQEETIDSSSAGTSRETQEESQTPQKEEEYIDEAYVDANYGGGEEEDLSKYEETSDTGQAGSGGSSQASSDGTSGSSAQGGTQNGSAQSAQANEENYYTDPVPEGMPEPVEPQDTAVNQDSQLTCTLLVECSTILNNMGDLTEGKESLVPSDGIIYGPATVVFYEGESVYDVLLREMQNNRIHMEAEFTPMYNSAYVEGINNLYEFDCGRWSGWMSCVNGWYPNYGASRYQVRQGDVIEWRYTCDLGRDLGRDTSGWQE